MTRFPKISNGRKEYWAKMDPAEKKRRMSAIAKKRIAKMTYRERREWAMKLVAARLKKTSVKPPVEAPRQSVV